MKKNNVRQWLTLSLILMFSIPLIAGYFLVRDLVSSSFSLSTHDQTIAALQLGQDALKSLAKKDLASEDIYRNQFQQIQEIKLNLAERVLLQQRILNSFATYFVIILFAVLAISSTLAIYLSARVNRAYSQNLKELIKEREKRTFLENLDRWQDVAKQLAHEIKNPLQPIGAWMNNLKMSYQRDPSPSSFLSLLNEATACVHQEVARLKDLVDSFTQFSRLPKADLRRLEVNSFLESFVILFCDSWSVHFSILKIDAPIFILADANLLKQVLCNLAHNAVEANPNQKIDIKLSVVERNSQIELAFENSGKTIDQSIEDKIFEPYFSTHSTKANFGLGLSICRKIMLEHQGDIRIHPCQSGAKFVLSFPKAGD